MTKETIEVEAIHFPVSSVDDLDGALDGYAKVEGTAAAGDGHPAVSCEGFVVELVELPDWPEDVLGQPVIVKGRLLRDGERLVMEKALYETL